MFVFGTQYLRGASPERDQWDRDLYHIREGGFNTVRAWLVWNAIEREEGRFDYEYLSTFLETAKRNDLKVGLLFHLHACPEWALQRYGQYLYQDEKQIPFPPAVRPNTPSGGWPGLCFDNPQVRELEKRFIEGVMAETSRHDCVSFYEPMNEPHQWVDMKQTPAGIFCYCPATVARFRQWLRRKYGDIAVLNDAWGHFYSDFEQIRPPRWTVSYADYADFRLFSMDNVAEEIAYRSEIIRARDDKPVVAHAWGGGAVTCANLGGMAFDDWKNARIFDKWGYSAFPGSADDCAALGMGCDATRCAADGKEYWQSELTAGMRGVGLHLAGRVDEKTFDQFCLESIRHGAKGLLFWQYRKERFGGEWGGFALTDYDGGPTALSRRAEALCRAVLGQEEDFLQGSLPKARVALLFSIRSYLADWVSNDRRDNAFAVDSISGYYRMLWEENITVDVIHEDFLPDLSSYRVIILPSPYAVSEGCAAALKDFVREGGVLLSDPFFGAFEQSFKLSYTVPGMGFGEVFGCRELDMTARDPVGVRTDRGVQLLKGNRQLELLLPCGAEVLYTTDDGHPLLLSNEYGKGKALLACANLGVCYSKRSRIGDDSVGEKGNDSLLAKQMVLDVVLASGVPANPCSARDVKVSVLTGENRALAILINSAPQKATGHIALSDDYDTCRVVWGEGTGSVAESRLGFDLPPCGSMMLALTREGKEGRKTAAEGREDIPIG